MNKKSVFHIPSDLTDPTLMTKSRGYSVRNISIFVALISVVLAVVSYRGLERSQKLATTSSRYMAPLEEVLHEHSVQSPSETVGDKERESLSEEVKALREEIVAFQASRGKAKKDVDPMTALLIKLAFSVFFGLAAMYVVLSRKYDDETKKWAFSVLALISGVWIGTAS